MNITEAEEPQPDEYVYILPLIVILGLSGNIISLVTIFHSRLRNIHDVIRGVLKYAFQRLLAQFCIRNLTYPECQIGT
ncbi:hypothetical protein KIN20_034862 [Parelaphostrongylus tenuis]|uniref:Uncharacterized protein n=1 Tax=Parelaphostrongylus tenuis TaxID=148309 RepID=A0AAD5RAC6_PARTN|nr:hypothetical protein KIN20_034862 [Parelaphostrongylus tenuis]